jgi:hypothetical protein
MPWRSFLPSRQGIIDHLWGGLILAGVLAIIAAVGGTAWGLISGGRMVMRPIFLEVLYFIGVLAIAVGVCLFAIRWLEKRAGARRSIEPAKSLEQLPPSLTSQLATMPTMDEMRAQVAAADARAAEAEERELQRKRERERPDVERFREIYFQVATAAVYATDSVVPDLPLAAAHGNRAHMLMYNLLNTYVVPPCRRAKDRLDGDLNVSSVAPLETIISDLQCLLREYGTLVGAIEEAARAILRPREFFGLPAFPPTGCGASPCLRPGEGPGRLAAGPPLDRLNRGRGAATRAASSRRACRRWRGSADSSESSRPWLHWGSQCGADRLPMEPGVATSLDRAGGGARRSPAAVRRAPGRRVFPGTAGCSGRGERGYFAAAARERLERLEAPEARVRDALVARASRSVSEGGTEAAQVMPLAGIPLAKRDLAALADALDLAFPNHLNLPVHDVAVADAGMILALPCWHKESPSLPVLTSRRRFGGGAVWLVASVRQRRSRSAGRGGRG